MKHFKYFISIFFSIYLFISCETASTYIEPNNSSYTSQEIKISIKFFSKEIITHKDYSLQCTGYISDTEPHDDDDGIYKTVVGKNYIFLKSGIKKYTVSILKINNILKFKNGIFFILNENIIINIHDDYGNIKTVNFAKKDSTYLIQDKSKNDLIINIEKRKKTYQYGKVWTLLGPVISGATVIINNEEFAIIDLMSKPSIYYNNNFSIFLNEDEKNYITLLMLCVFDYNRSIQNILMPKN